MGAAESARQAETIGGLSAQVGNREREVGRLTAKLERADATLAAQAASHARISRQSRRLRIALGVAVTLAIAAGLAPSLVR